MILQTEGNEADELCGRGENRFFLNSITCKMSNIVDFDLRCMHFSGLFNTCE